MHRDGTSRESQRLILTDDTSREATGVGPRLSPAEGSQLDARPSGRSVSVHSTRDDRNS